MLFVGFLEHRRHPLCNAIRTLTHVRPADLCSQLAVHEMNLMSTLRQHVRSTVVTGLADCGDWFKNGTL